MLRLVSRLGFPLSGPGAATRVLTDEPVPCGGGPLVPVYAPPTKAAILSSLAWLVEGARPGDTLFLHYSGHGSQLRDQNGDEADGWDETLCPSDFQRHGEIRDDTIFDVVCRDLPAGVRLTAVMDCCHSGSVMDLEFEWVPDRTGTSVTRRRGGGGGSSAAAAVAVRSRGFRVASAKHSAASIVCFSGCKDAGTSSDVANTGSFKHGLAGRPGAAGGACTNALASVLGQGASIGYVQLLCAIRADLQRRQFEQVPQMTSSQPIDLDRPFSLFGPLV